MYAEPPLPYALQLILTSLYAVENSRRYPHAKTIDPFQLLVVSYLTKVRDQWLPHTIYGHPLGIAYISHDTPNYEDFEFLLIPSNKIRFGLLRPLITKENDAYVICDQHDFPIDIFTRNQYRERVIQAFNLDPYYKFTTRRPRGQANTQT